MAIKIEMPKLSDTMEEGVIAKWSVKEGDSVNAGDIIAEVETDKATMDVEVYDPGVVLKLLAAEGEAVPLGKPMAIIGEEGEDISALLEDGAEKPAPSEAPKEETTSSNEAFADPIFGGIDSASSSNSKAEEASSTDNDGRIKASPLARKIAEEKGLNLGQIKGSGPDGRIIKKDVESAKKDSVTEAPKAEAPKAAPVMPTEGDEDLRISQMRKAIARRLAESKFTNPHFYETIDIDMKRAIAARTELNATSDVKISFNDLVVKACAVALKKHRNVNASWLGDVIRQYGDVHIAVAVAVEDGLVTPVITHADKKGMSVISAETKELAAAARDKKLKPEQMEGSTFTISNLGMFGIEEFTSIINPPNAAILAVGAIRDVPVVEDGAVVPGKRMKVTLSADHRVVDGAKAAEFLNTLRGLLENPMSMLL